MKYKDKRIIGITGGIGSGKTKILDIIKSKYDILCIEADKIGHEIQKPGEEAYNRIVKEFGKHILEEPYVVGKSYIDRKKLGNVVFSDEEQLRHLNEIAHPIIHDIIDQIIRNSTKQYIFIEAAILTETSLINLTDEVWYIYADKTVRLNRLEQYRQITREKAKLIMESQPDEEYFRSKCNVIIDNSGSTDDTLKQIKNILDKRF